MIRMNFIFADSPATMFPVATIHFLFTVTQRTAVFRDLIHSISSNKQVVSVRKRFIYHLTAFAFLLTMIKNAE